MSESRPKVALVTGAGTGIGRAIAETLSSERFIVVLAGRRPGPLRETVESIRAQGGVSYDRPVDVRSEKQVKSLFKWIADELGRLDVLVNNAGIGNQGLIAEGLVEEWNDVLKTNLLAFALCSREAIGMMKVSGGGNIVVISSQAAGGMPGRAIYSASKAGVDSLAEALNGEVGRDHIRVTIISPGYVRVEDTKRDHRLEQSMALLTPIDVATAVKYVVTQPAHVHVGLIVLRPTSL